MRRLHGRGKLPAFAGKDPRSCNLTTFFAPLEKPLHAQAYPEKRLAGRSALQHGLAQPRPVQSLQRGKMSHSWQYDLVRRYQRFRVVRNHNFSTELVERLLHGIEVAGAVIHDGDHSSPLVLGSMRPRRRAREHASRRARAKALKSASILWWLDRPYNTRAWMLARAPRAKPSKKSYTSSACRSPTRAARTLVSTTAVARPPKSTAAKPRVSSMGITK